MIKSAAIIKTKALAPWKELRLEKRRLKKAQTIERKAIKQVCPTPIGRREPKVEAPVDNGPATRNEMLQQAEVMGLKVDKRWSDATLLKHIEESAWATKNDNS
jgi:hypothetical protein